MTRYLLVIGAQRSGTTYLLHLLEGHPEVEVARPVRPEPKVFLSSDAAAHGAGWYRQTYFPHATDGQLLVEKSTSYLDAPSSAARAREVLGAGVHVVAQLRDPVDRAVSNWRFSATNGLEGRPLERALEESLTGQRREWDPSLTSASPYAYLERGRYVDHLKPWMAAFPDTVHVTFLEETAGEPASLAALFELIGIDPSYRPDDMRAPLNVSDGGRPRLSDRLLKRLRAYYRDSDERLAAQLGRALPWATGPAAAGERPLG